MALSCFVYYRVDPARTADCESAIRSVLAEVRAGTGITGRLMKKRGEPDLWMEVYEGIADEAKFERELAGATGRHRVGDYLLPGSRRHVERFEDK